MPSRPIGPLTMFLIPIYGQDGKPHRPETWKHLERRLLDFRGHSGPISMNLFFRSGPPIPGMYLDLEGNHVHDECFLFLLALPADEVHQIRALLEEACDIFDQDWIFLSVAGVGERVFAPPDPSRGCLCC